MLFALAILALDSCRPDVPDAKRDVEPLTVKSATLPDRVAGEYVVTVLPGFGDAMLREQYGEYGIREIVALGRNSFLLKLKKDPGLDVIRQKAIKSGGIKAVQPNFVYRGRP